MKIIFSKIEKGSKRASLQQKHNKNKVLNPYLKQQRTEFVFCFIRRSFVIFFNILSWSRFEALARGQWLPFFEKLLKSIPQPILLLVPTPWATMHPSKWSLCLIPENGNSLYTPSPAKLFKIGNPMGTSKT